MPVLEKSRGGLLCADVEESKVQSSPVVISFLSEEG